MRCEKPLELNVGDIFMFANKYIGMIYAKSDSEYFIKYINFIFSVKTERCKKIRLENNLLDLNAHYYPCKR